jgi:hypothetical protein
MFVLVGSVALAMDGVAVEKWARVHESGLQMAQALTGNCPVHVSVDATGAVQTVEAADACPEVLVRAAEESAWRTRYVASGVPSSGVLMWSFSGSGNVVCRVDDQGQLLSCPRTLPDHHEWAGQDVVFYGQSAIGVDSHRQLMEAPSIPGATGSCPVRMHVQASGEVSRIDRIGKCYWALDPSEYAFVPGEAETIVLVLGGHGVVPFWTWVERSAVGCLVGAGAAALVITLVRQPAL